MQIGEAEPCGVLLHASRGQRGNAGVDEGHRPGLHQIFVLWKPTDCCLSAPRRYRGRPPSGSPSDGEDGTGSDLQTAENQPTASAAQGLSLSAAGHDDRAAEPGLVFRHHLHSREARFPVSGCNHGLGDTESPELAAVEYDARRLLRRSLERGYRPVRTAGDHEH